MCKYICIIYSLNDQPTHVRFPFLGRGIQVLCGISGQKYIWGIQCNSFCLRTNSKSYWLQYNCTEIFVVNLNNLNSIISVTTCTCLLDKSLNCNFHLQGSGKTYTVGGGNMNSITEEEYGVIPRALKDMFDYMQVRAYWLSWSNWLCHLYFN